MKKMLRFIGVGFGGISLFTFVVVFLSNIGKNIKWSEFLINWLQLNIGIIGCIVGIFLVLLGFGWALDGEPDESIFSYYKKIFNEMKEELED